MIPQSPATLNPRGTLDANSQWLSALQFRALTRLDANLQPIADLSSSWTSTAQGDRWTFQLRDGLVDHAGNLISADRLVRCLENYQKGELKSPLRTLMPHWTGARTVTPAPGSAAAIEIQLSRPDPTLPQTLAAFRYFLPDSNTGPSEPCSDPVPGQKLIGNGPYQAEPWDATPRESLRLLSRRTGWPDLLFLFVQDDNTRVLKMIRGEVDATLNGISLTKTKWLQETAADRFDIMHRPGARVSYLAFNLRDRILSKREVRQAIAHSIDRESIVKAKLGTFGKTAGSIVSPLLPDGHETDFRYSPKTAELLLDQAGFPRGRDGLRFELRYKTTPAREGMETGIILSEMLARVGIRIKLEILEPAVFFASIRKNSFQLYSSRWLGVTDGSILFRTLRSEHPANRSGYSDPAVDKLLDLAMAEIHASKRKELFSHVQNKIAHDMPFLPLWYWYNTLIVKKGILKPDANAISLNGSFDVFSELR